MSWVTYTDSELGMFGLDEKQLIQLSVRYRRLDKGFYEDERAVVDNYAYDRLVLLASKPGLFGKQRILGGTMIAPNSSELIRELILADTSRLSVKAIFNKGYLYPVASRVNQSLLTDLLAERITPFIKTILRRALKKLVYGLAKFS